MSAYPATTTDPTAVSGRRFGAYVIDTLVILALFWGLFFATAGITIYRDPTTCADIRAKAGELSSSERCTDGLDVTVNSKHYTAATWKPRAWVIAGGAAFLYLLLVEWILQAATGATLGKAIFGIRTVDEQGRPPGLGKQFLRGLLWIIDGLCDGLVALVLILVSKGHRRLGDMAAKTFVVRTASTGAPIIVPGMALTGMEGATAGAAPVGAPATGYGATTPTTTSGYTPPTTPTTTTGYTPPTTPTTTAGYSPPTTPTPPAAAPAASGPQWDAARNAYIQWDAAGNRWMTYDDAASQWKPLEGEQPPPPA